MASALPPPNTIAARRGVDLDPLDHTEDSPVNFRLSDKLTPIALKALEGGEFFKEANNLNQVCKFAHCLKLRATRKFPFNIDKGVIETEWFGELDLFKYRNECDISIEFIRVIATQLVEALVKMHKIKAVHTDFKPENVAIKFPCQAQVIDFGDMIEEGVGSAALGTLRYAPLEVLLALPANYRSDLRSLGLTLFFAYTGQDIANFFEDAEDIPEINPVIKRYEEQLMQRNLSMQATKLFIGTFICLHELDKAFKIPSDLIKSACEFESNADFDKVRNAMCAFMFEFDSKDNTFKLKDLDFELPEVLSWENIIKKRAEELRKLKEAGFEESEEGVEAFIEPSFEENEEDIEAFIEFIRCLCSYEPLEADPLTAEKLLSSPFLSNNFAFKIKVSKELLKKNYQLKISSSDGKKTLVLVNLNRSQESIEEQCFHLIKKYGPEYKVTIIDNDDQIIEDKGNIKITEDSTLVI